MVTIGSARRSRRHPPEDAAKGRGSVFRENHSLPQWQHLNFALFGKVIPHNLAAHV